MFKSLDRGSLQALGCIWLVALFLYVLTHCISPLLPVLITEYNLNHATGGLLYALPIVMIALFSYPLGILSDRVGTERSIGYGAAIAIVASLLRMFSFNFSFLLVNTALFGLGFAFCFPNLPKLVKEKFPPQFAGTATGAYTTAIPFGTGVAMVLTRPMLALTGDWRYVLLIWTAAAFPSVLLWWIVGIPGTSRFSTVKAKESLAHGSSDQEMKHVSPKSPFLALTVCGLLLALLNLIFYCTIGWLPTYLTERGWAAASAATATSFISFTEVPAMFLVPLLSDRTGKRRPILILSFVLIAVCSAVVAVNPAVIWFVIPILGVTMGGVFALLLSLPIELVEKKKVGRTAGAIISIGYVGAVIGPPAAGYVRDSTGNFAVAFFATALLGLAAAALSYWLPAPQRFKIRDRKN